MPRLLSMPSLLMQRAGTTPDFTHCELYLGSGFLFFDLNIFLLSQMQNYSSRVKELFSIAYIVISHSSRYKLTRWKQRNATDITHCCVYKERCGAFWGLECHLRESQSLLLVIEIQPLCFCFLLMMHLCLLRDGITPPRDAQHSHSHPVLFTLFLTPSAPVSLRRGLFNYRFSTQSLLTGCKSGRTLTQSQTADVDKSLSTSSSTSSTGPRCRTFTYTEHLSNLH